MVFLTRVEKEEPSKNKSKKINPIYVEVLSRISYAKKSRENIPADLDFVDKTISYKRKSEGEFKKGSHGPGVIGALRGRKSSIPGVEKAAEKAFSNEKDKNSVSSIFSLIENYENSVVMEYYNSDIESMVNSFNNYKEEFQEKYYPIKEKTKFEMKNEMMTAALLEIGEDFWKYMHEVDPIVVKLVDKIHEKNHPGIYT